MRCKKGPSSHVAKLLQRSPSHLSAFRSSKIFATCVLTIFFYFFLFLWLSLILQCVFLHLDQSSRGCQSDIWQPILFIGCPTSSITDQSGSGTPAPSTPAAAAPAKPNAANLMSKALAGFSVAPKKAPTPTPVIPSVPSSTAASAGKDKGRFRVLRVFHPCVIFFQYNPHIQYSWNIHTVLNKSI